MTTLIPLRSWAAYGVGVATACLLAIAPVQAQEPLYPGMEPALLEAAKAEGEVNLYCAMNEETTNETARAFEKLVPEISVRVLRLATVQLYSRLAAEKEAGVHEVDVYCSSDTRSFELHPDWWIDLTPDVIPTMSLLPERAHKGKSLIMTQLLAMMAYNTNQMSEDEAPQTWQDLVKPEFKGRGLFVDPRNSTTYLTWVDYMYDLYGPDYLRQLADQDFELVSSGAPGSQEVAAGGADFIFPITRSHASAVMAKGAPVDVIEPWKHSDVSATGSEIELAIASEAPHPNAAKLFLSWLLTPEAQKINCGAGAYAPLSLSEDDRGECPPFADNVELTRDISDERRAELLELLNLQ